LSARAAVVLLTIVLGSVGGGIAVYATWTDYVESVASVERRVADLARLLDDHFTHALQATDLLLVHVAEHVRAEGLGGLAPESLNWAEVKAAVSGFAHLESLFILDPNGRLVAGSSVAAPAVEIANADFVPAIGGGARSMVGQVTRDPWSGAYVFPVVRSLSGPSGAFSGIAVANIRVSFFKGLYHGLNLGADPALGVYRLDGSILVREPLAESDIGHNMSDNPIFTRYLPQAPIGTYHGRSSYDGVERIVSYRKVEARQLLVWVAMSQVEALKPWERRLYRNAGLATFGLAITVVLTVMALRAVNRESQAKADLLQSNQSLQRANAELERFAEIAAHHLQEPLRSIASYAQLLERRLESQVSGDVKEFLHYLVSGSNDMKQLLHDLHRYTALQQGEPPAREVALNDVVARAVAQLQPRIRATGTELELGELPRIHGDAIQMQMLFRQLFENALTYRSPSRPLRIAVWAERWENSWMIAVRDNGMGVDPRFKERIFRIFERLHPRERFPGTGIGLAICRKIVERHGGHISCSTDQSEGTTFTFTVAA
jgi:signal transduction histidine kinase